MSFHGIIVQTETVNKRYSGQCQLCDFVTTKMFRDEAASHLRQHLMEFHRVPPTIVQAAPFVPVSKGPEKSGESKRQGFNSQTNYA